MTEPGSAGCHSEPAQLRRFSVPSEPGNERRTSEEVVRAVGGLGLAEARLERLKTAVAEATMNAMEHGNRYDPEKPTVIEVLASAEEVAVRITDEGPGPAPGADPYSPDLEAKLDGLQTPRGWGLFLIKNMVDEMRVGGDDSRHTVELVLRLEPRPRGERR